MFSFSSSSITHTLRWVYIKDSGTDQGDDCGWVGYVQWTFLAAYRAYPNNRVVMRPSEKSEAKAAGQKCSEAWFAPR